MHGCGSFTLAHGRRELVLNFLKTSPACLEYVRAHEYQGGEVDTRVDSKHGSIPERLLHRQERVAKQDVRAPVESAAKRRTFRANAARVHLGVEKVRDGADATCEAKYEERHARAR